MAKPARVLGLYPNSGDNEPNASEESMELFLVGEIAHACALYNDPTRHYHNWLHITKCLALVEKLDLDKKTKFFLSVSFLYHDAIYIPGMESEKLSKRLLSSRLMQLQRNHPFNGSFFSAMGWICPNLILLKEDLAKKYPDFAEQYAGLKSLFDDIDYAILGADWGEYKRYVEGVKKEYLNWCTEAEFWAGRNAWLNNLRCQPYIFENAKTSVLFHKLEEQAQKNIRDEYNLIHPIAAK